MMNSIIIKTKIKIIKNKRIQCLKCLRSNFSNLQGFLNHCRISHKMEFPSHEEATRLCGIVVVRNYIYYK